MHFHEEHSMMSRRDRFQSPGFSLLELMVAMVVTLVITGAMYGLVVSGQGSFRREPALSDRQQQIRIAMARIEEDMLRAGLGLGPTVQSFAQNMNGLGILGVRALSDSALGGGNSDFIEIRTKTDDCPSVRVDPVSPRNGANYNATDYQFQDFFNFDTLDHSGRQRFEPIVSPRDQSAVSSATK